MGFSLKFRLVRLNKILKVSPSYLYIGDTQNGAISGESNVTAVYGIWVNHLGNQYVVNDHKAVTVYRTAAHSNLGAGDILIKRGGGVEV